MAKKGANGNRTLEFYRRKCHDLALELRKVNAGVGQIKDTLDAIMIKTAIRYGEKVRDEDAPGKRKPVIGYRLEIAEPDFGDLINYDLKVQREDGVYKIGVIKRIQEGA